MEIERKFTITGLPDDLEQHTCLIIEQAYLNTDPVLRIRRQNDDYYLTYKGKGLLAREECNLPLNKEAYEHLRTKADEEKWWIQHEQTERLQPKMSIRFVFRKEI